MTVCLSVSVGLHCCKVWATLILRQWQIFLVCLCVSVSLCLFWWLSVCCQCLLTFWNRPAGLKIAPTDYSTKWDRPRDIISFSIRWGRYIHHPIRVEIAPWANVVNMVRGKDFTFLCASVCLCSNLSDDFLSRLLTCLWPPNLMSLWQTGCMMMMGCLLIWQSDHNLVPLTTHIVSQLLHSNCICMIISSIYSSNDISLSVGRSVCRYDPVSVSL